MDVQPLLRRLSPAIIVDVETGGLDPANAPLLELSIGVVTDGYLGEVRTWRVEPYDAGLVEPGAAAVNGYTTINEWCRWGALSEAEALHEATAFLVGLNLERLTWIGHNTPYDRALLRAAASRSGMPGLDVRCAHRDVDTMALATIPHAIGLVPGRSLDALADRAGIARTTNVHRADEDVRITWGVLQWLLQHLQWAS